MSDLNISQKNIFAIFSDYGVKFLIPDYQRNYSWDIEHCETLWEDLKNFSIPNENLFDDRNDEYFLGTILTVTNSSRQKEVIDGQQRLITILLLLRTFYENLDKNKNLRLSLANWK